MQLLIKAKINYLLWLPISFITFYIDNFLLFIIYYLFSCKINNTIQYKI